MKIGIIGAMDEELNPVRGLAQDVEQVQHGQRTFWSGRAADHTIILTRCDPGKVNGAIAAQQLIDRYAVEAVFNMGSAGGVSPTLQVGDIVIASEAIQHDVDYTGWGIQPGEMLFDVYLSENTGQLQYRTQRAFKTDERLAQLALAAANGVELSPVGGRVPSVHQGRILSGDQFIHDRAKVKQLWQTFQGLCADMEAAAIAQTCALNDVPFLIIRTISDKADGSAAISFTDFLLAATVNYGAIVERVISQLD